MPSSEITTPVVGLTWVLDTSLSTSTTDSGVPLDKEQHSTCHEQELTDISGTRVNGWHQGE